MLRGEKQVELATLRMELRSIDAEIAVVRRESRRYREMRFGLDIKEIQLTALQDQRDTCVARIAELQKQLHINGPRRTNPLAWLLLPIALWAHLQKSFASREEPQPLPMGSKTPVFDREPIAIGAGH
jgi:hypothetical protein